MRLVISTTKLTARTVVIAARWFLRQQEQNKSQQQQEQAQESYPQPEDDPWLEDDSDCSFDFEEPEVAFPEDDPPTSLRHGRQSIHDLVEQNQNLTNIPIETTGLRDFERVAKKYGIDYAVTKDRSATPPKYLVFFKAKDSSVMQAALNDYTAKILRKGKQPSLTALLAKSKDLVSALPNRLQSKGHEEHSR